LSASGRIRGTLYAILHLFDEHSNSQWLYRDNSTVNIFLSIRGVMATGDQWGIAPSQILGCWKILFLSVNFFPKVLNLGPKNPHF